MPAREPEEVQRLWADRFVAGDLEGLLELYEPDAALVAQPGQAANGLVAIREALSGFLALRQSFSLDVKLAARTPDLALLHSGWTLTGTGPDGNPLELRGTTADVVRRQSDGSWRIAIDNPWGTV